MIGQKASVGRRQCLESRLVLTVKHLCQNELRNPYMVISELLILLFCLFELIDIFAFQVTAAELPKLSSILY